MSELSNGKGKKKAKIPDLKTIVTNIRLMIDKITNKTECRIPKHSHIYRRIYYTDTHIFCDKRDSFVQWEKRWSFQ